MKRQLTTFVLLGASLCPGSEALDRALRPPLGGQTTHPFIYSLTPSLSRKGRQLRPSSWEGSGAVLRAGDREVAGPAGAAQGSGVAPSSHFSVYIQDRRASGVGDVRPPNVPWRFFLCPLRALGRWRPSLHCLPRHLCSPDALGPPRDLRPPSAATVLKDGPTPATRHLRGPTSSPVKWES